MSDLERLKQMFRDFGIGFKEEKRESNVVITIETHIHAKVTGYGGFLSEYLFNEDGKFQGVSIWE